MNTSYLIQGLALGIAAGASPGPLIAITIAQVMRDGWSAALKISLGSLVVSVARAVVVFLLLSALPKNPIVIGVIAVAGAIFLLYMAYNSFNYKPKSLDSRPAGNSVLLGMLGNLLSPYAYIFWITVGGPIMLGAQAKGMHEGIFLFVSAFVLAVLAINMAIGLLAAQMKTYMNSEYYVYVLRLLAIVFVVFAFLFLRQAYQSFTM